MAVITCDGAVWHPLGGALVIPDNIVLLHLPPYSPALNPMEDVWDYLRQNKLCALVWHSVDAIVDACKAAWNWFIADPETHHRNRHTRMGVCQSLAGLV